jgi:dienelactone hydrolase
MKRAVGAWIAVLACLFVPAGASAAPPVSSVFAGQTVSGDPIPCSTLADRVRVCHGASGASDLRLKSFDGVPLEVYVILPPAPVSGNDGGYPLVVQSHGWGGSAAGPNGTAYSGPTAHAWANDGYAVLQLTARGWGGSCGSPASRMAAPTACLAGYVRLDDDRYEVRDVQYAAGLLVDGGIVDRARIGATGPSYGGGVSLQLATLRDRVMAADGSLAPWRSPGGTPLHLAAAAPVIPWSDLAYSLMPNGHTLDDVVTSPTADLSPIGVSKQSFVGGLYLAGQLTGYYSPPGTNPQADLTTWNTTINAGEPYDANPAAQAIAQQIARYHSAYYLLDGAFGTAREAPAPLLIANGFTDDLFPVDEALRYYNLDRSLYPSDPIALFDFDGGHMRGQNKGADASRLSSRIKEFLDHYVRGSGAQPQLGATALTQTCPKTAPSGGPFSAPTWAALHPGEVDYSTQAARTVSSAAGDPSIGAKLDPVLGGGACVTVPGADQGAGVATYRLRAVTGNGYTLLGSPAITATLRATGTFPIVAERLWDVDPATGSETLVARGVYRLDASHPNGRQVFQLHPGAWHFAAGHIPKLELLGRDVPYVRASNGTFQITVSDLTLQLPVHDVPGAAGVPPEVVRSPHTTPGICVSLPFARIGRMAFSHAPRPHAAARRVQISGTARESRCPHMRRLARVRRVFVIIYRRVAHHRCRFVKRSGALTRPRACAAPVELVAHGTSHWVLGVRRIPAGHYLVRTDAVDGLHHHSLRGSLPIRLRIP